MHEKLRNKNQKYLKYVAQLHFLWKVSFVAALKKGITQCAMAAKDLLGYRSDNTQESISPRLQNLMKFLSVH